MRLITIAERVKKQIPQLQIYIVGNRPPEKLKQKENQWIHVTGFVEDVDIYLKTAALAVFPLTLGAGIKLKVFKEPLHWEQQSLQETWALKALMRIIR